jgi:hypothetical protein
MISDGKEDCSESDKFNDNNNSIKDKKCNIKSSVNNYPMFVGEKNIQNSNRGFNRAVVEADESVVGTDVMNPGVAGMQADGESVVQAGESIVVAVVAGDIVMDVQMYGKNVMDARENVVDVVYADAAVVGVHTDDRRAAVAVVMGAFVLDAGTSSSDDISDAESDVDAEASCANGFFNSGKMVMQKTRNMSCSRGKVCGKEFRILGE